MAPDIEASSAAGLILTLSASISILDRFSLPMSSVARAGTLSCQHGIRHATNVRNIATHVAKARRALLLPTLVFGNTKIVLLDRRRPTPYEILLVL